MQIVAGGTVIDGWLAMVTVTCAVAVHPRASPVTVYVTVEVGLAITVAPVVVFSEADGLHVYVFAPLAVSVVFCPKHKVMFGETVTTGTGFTVTVVCADAEHPFASVPVIVYVVVDAGFAVTGEPVVLLKAVAGVQEYVIAPFAVNVTD